MRLPPAEVERILESWPVASLAALGPEGEPWQVPVVFARAVGRLWSPVDGKPKRSAALARLEHVKRDPRVSLLLDHWDADWSRLWWLRLEGRAQVVTGTGIDLPPIERALRAKYPQYANVDLFGGPPTLIEIEVTRTASWSAS